jgi:hypothetical protein
MLKYYINIYFLLMISLSSKAQSVEVFDLDDMESIIHEETGKNRR